MVLMLSSSLYAMLTCPRRYLRQNCSHLIASHCIKCLYSSESGLGASLKSDICNKCRYAYKYKQSDQSSSMIDIYHEPTT